jgi:hypothetical protein
MVGRNAIILVAAAIVAVGTSSLSAQQTTIGVPNTTVGHSFYEQFGVNWGLRGNGWFFNFGGPVAPPFGGFDPNAGANFGHGGPRLQQHVQRPGTDGHHDEWRHGGL